MNLGDGIYQHRPNEHDTLIFPGLGTTGNNLRDPILLTPYRLPGVAAGRWFMASGSAPATGPDYPVVEAFVSGATTYRWQAHDVGWPHDLTLVIEGCTHDGSEVTEGTRRYLEAYPVGGSPSPLAAARPFFGIDGRSDTILTQRMGLLDPDNWFEHTSSLPTITIDPERLYQSLFIRHPLPGLTLAVSGAPAAGDDEVVLSGFTYGPGSGFGFGAAIGTDRIGDTGNMVREVCTFGTDKVRYKLAQTSATEGSPGSWSVTFSVSPPFLARTIAGMGGPTFLPRHEIPVGRPFDVRLDLVKMERQVYFGASLVSTDTPEWWCASSLFFSWFE